MMSDPAIVASITQLVCDHGGRLAVAELPRHLSLSPAHIAGILREEASCFLLLEEAGVVLALSGLRLCGREQCPATDCARLHLCRFHLLGKCTRKGCPFSHDIYSEVNKAVLKAFKISTLDKKALQVLLQLNDPSFLPEVCVPNKGESKDGSCAQGAICKSLHICGFFIRGQCRNPNCHRSHNLLDPGNIRVLQTRRLSSDMIQNIQLMRTHQCQQIQKQFKKTNTKESQRESLKAPAPVEEGDPNEICLHNLRKFCKNQNKCMQVHFYLPYRWQIFIATQEWRDMNNMEKIEEAFCDPNQSSCELYEIDFQKMTSSLNPVRRLSTASSATKPPDYILTTEWVWYWKNEFGQWIEYGKHCGKDTATINSAALESAYLTDQKTTMKFQAGSHSYEIHFQDMTQTNVAIGTKRAVLRRPLFVSQEDVQKLKARKAEAFPANWDKMTKPDLDFKLVDVHEHSSEFKKIKHEFEKTMVGFSLEKIKRIQNKPLWQAYQMKLKNMKTINNGKDVPEKKLFHGSDNYHVDTICRENFDWRIYGVREVLYGKGNYFSRDASYSHQHCNSSSSNKAMFLARVLVGDYVKGNTSYLRPPPKPTNPRQAYDSCVDHERNPSIFVVFEKHQIYPDYLLEYTEDKTERMVQDNVRYTTQNVQYDWTMVHNKVQDQFSPPKMQYTTQTKAQNQFSSPKMQYTTQTKAQDQFSPPKMQYTTQTTAQSNVQDFSWTKAPEKPQIKVEANNEWQCCIS